MGFWNKLGKIALTAAPYVAAPFTGGASLAARPFANAAVQKWNEKDAQKNAAKGLAPSRTDQFIGMGGNLAGGFGGGGNGKGFGGIFGGGQKQEPNWGNHGIMDRMPGGFPGQTPPFLPTNQGGGGGGWQDMLGGIFNQIQQGRQQQPQQQGQAQGQQPIGGSNALPWMNLRTPNLANPLLQGINQGRASRQMPPVSPDQYTGYNW